MFKKFIKKMLRLCETPSVRLEKGIGVPLVQGFRIGLMQGSINTINQKRSKYILMWYFNTEYKPVEYTVFKMKRTIAFYEEEQQRRF